MTRNEIIEKVNALLAEEFEVNAEAFTPDANVKDTLSLDSLSLVDLVMVINHAKLQNVVLNKETWSIVLNAVCAGFKIYVMYALQI